MFLEKELFRNLFHPEIDICKDNLCVNNNFFPIGYFAAEALNIRDEDIAILKQYSDMIQGTSAIFKQSQSKNMSSLLHILREAIADMIHTLCELPPFTSWMVDDEIRKLDIIFCDISIETILKPGLINSFFWKYIEDTTSVSTAIRNYRDAGRLLEESFLRNVPRRDEQNFAAATNECFCSNIFLDLIFSEQFALVNFPFSPSLRSSCTFTRDPDDENKLLFLDTIVFDSYMDFFVYDLLNGMHHGHAPSKCQNCGRYFLTTDARKPKYCYRKAIQNPHYTCRQYGAMNQQKEKNANHPVFQIYKTRTGTIRKHHQRGKITDEERQKAMKVCEELRDRALFDTEFAQGEYLRLMEQDAIYAEVSRRLVYGDTHDE